MSSKSFLPSRSSDKSESGTGRVPAQEENDATSSKASRTKRTRRGRGRGFGRAPPRSAVSTVPTFSNNRVEIPKPTSLSTTDSVLKNDPLMDDSYAGPYTPVLYPKQMVPTVRPSFAGLPQIIDEIYGCLVAADKNFRRSVTPAAFTYYCAQLLVQRVVAIRVAQGHSTKDEDRFLQNTEGDLFHVPGILDHYLRGIGEFTLANGKRFLLDLPNYANASWGKVSATNHYKYMAYPSMQALVSQIQAELADPFVAKWELPATYTPDTVKMKFPGVQGEKDVTKMIPPGLPTPNFWGYRYVTKPTSDARELLERCDVTPTSFRTDLNKEFLYNKELMNQISARLETLHDRYSMTVGVPTSSPVGSISQGVIVRPFETVIPDLDSKLHYLQMVPQCAEYYTPLDTRILWGSIISAYSIDYQTFTLDQTTRYAWSCYEWSKYQLVPPDWQRSVNEISSFGRDNELNMRSLATAGHDRTDLILRSASKSEKIKGLEL